MGIWVGLWDCGYSSPYVPGTVDLHRTLRAKAQLFAYVRVRIYECECVHTGLSLLVLNKCFCVFCLPVHCSIHFAQIS